MSVYQFMSFVCTLVDLKCVCDFVDVELMFVISSVWNLCLEFSFDVDFMLRTKTLKPSLDVDFMLRTKTLTMICELSSNYVNM